MRFPQVSRIIPVVLVAGLASATSPVPAGKGDPGAARHRERPDDPPGRVSRADLERAAAAEVVRGNHISVQVNVDANGNNILGDAANEPSIAIDPTDPNNIVIGWRQFDTVASNFRQAGYGLSDDAGATWTFPGVLQPGQFRSDPVLGADNNGTFFYYGLSAATSAEMFLSTNKGVSWLGPFDGFGGDKEWMTIDVSGGGGDGNIYTTWNSQFTCCAAGTDFTRSIDGGFAFEGPFALPLKPKWGTLDVGPEGRLYVVGSQLNTSATPAHLLQRSTNAFDVNELPVFEHTAGIDLGGITAVADVPNPAGLLGQVWVAVDRSAGPTRGNVYVLASVDPPGSDPLDVMFLRSTDGGVTWTAPLRVNKDPLDNSAWQWFGTMSVAPDGRIDVIWNDTRSDPSGEISEVNYAYSTDAGTTWSSGLPVTPAFNSTVGFPNQNKIGDYYHMISDDLGASLAYSATFNGEQDIWFLRVGDCNGNGRHDSQDIALGSSPDCNHNGIPEECEETLLETCQDGVDNDCDGLIDCIDPDCFGDPTCCDFDTVCEPGEDCVGCPTDCPVGPTGCGNGVCEPRANEDCLSCPEDCAGDQQGNPQQQFCCGGAGGVNPVACDDPRCNDGDFRCIAQFQPACCGDRSCEFHETPCTCEVDCGEFTVVESSCADGIDNDCDDGTDCVDADCATAMPAPPVGSPTLDVMRDPLDIRLRWVAPPGAVTYDVIEGSLVTLRSSGGDFTAATTTCLADDMAGLEAGAPVSELDAWFLVRPSFCAGAGSFDTGAPGQSASRDAGIATSGSACP